jgi:hypothetical protein
MLTKPGAADDIRRRLFGLNAVEIRKFSDFEHRMLTALDSEVDLLSPIGDLRYEPTHTRAIAHLLRRAEVGPLASSLLRRLIIEVRGVSPSEDELNSAAIHHEYYLTPADRVDIAIEMRSFLFFIELKIDAGEGKRRDGDGALVGQFARYKNELENRAGNRDCKLILLTLDEVARQPGAFQFTFRDLLAIWLPFVDNNRAYSKLLVMYLRSIALLCQVCDQGGFRSWSFGRQRETIELITEAKTRFEADMKVL